MKQLDFTDSPLHQDDRGAIRVIGSRITLNTIVHTFKRGDTLEEIHEGFPSLSLAQIKGVIAWYFNHKAEADEYLEKVEAEADRLQREIESQPGYVTLGEMIKRCREQLIKK